MACWADQYVGKPADHTFARNCLGWTGRIVREQQRRHFPGMLSLVRSAMRGEAPPMVPTRRLRDGTVVVCGNAVNPVRHVGVYCAAADRVIHADNDAADGHRIVRAEPMWRLRHAWPWVSYWNVVSTAVLP